MERKEKTVFSMTRKKIKPNYIVNIYLIFEQRKKKTFNIFYKN